jgi:PadR family transcriptional regulator PadR
LGSGTGPSGDVASAIYHLGRGQQIPLRLRVHYHLGSSPSPTCYDGDLKSNFDIDSRVRVEEEEEQNRYLYSGLIRLHILHHAVHDPPLFGLGMLEELGRHGYKLSAGTLYPLLHGMEKRGYIRSKLVRRGSVERRVYRATALGRKALKLSKERVRELFGELFEE